MFLRMRCQSLMLKLGNVFLLVMVKMELAIISLIQVRRNLLEIDVVFFEDKTLEDFEKVEKFNSQNYESLINVDLVPLTIPHCENH